MTVILMNKKFFALATLLVSSLFLTACKDEKITNITYVNQGSDTQPEYIESTLYDLDEDNTSPNQDNRQMFLILHYTAVSKDETLALFKDPNFPASSHYFVPELSTNGKFTVYRLVPDDKRAWHAGASSWQTNSSLNASSIGIEIENLGFPADDEQLPLMQRRWYPFSSKQQIEVLADIILKITKKYEIRPDRILGHSDISPGRKFDPGPLFPWKRLYEDYNIGAWYDNDTVNYYRTYHPWKNDIASLQSKLALYGYNVPVTGQYDQVTRNVVSAFQMHFYPEKYDGIADIETVARLDALLEKYRNVARPAISP